MIGPSHRLWRHMDRVPNVTCDDTPPDKVYGLLTINPKCSWNFVNICLCKKTLEHKTKLCHYCEYLWCNARVKHYNYSHVLKVKSFKKNPKKIIYFFCYNNLSLSIKEFKCYLFLVLLCLLFFATLPKLTEIFLDLVKSHLIEDFTNWS